MATLAQTLYRALYEYDSPRGGVTPFEHLPSELQRHYADSAQAVLNARNAMRAALIPPHRRSDISSKASRTRWYGDFIPMPCPRCSSSETHHNGTRNGRQRWQCRPCRRSFYGDAA